ncbi:MAG TPA: hypothetical protein VF093_11175, partial [Solirubrobacterales bacterium]
MSFAGKIEQPEAESSSPTSLAMKFLTGIRETDNHLPFDNQAGAAKPPERENPKVRLIKMFGLAALAAVAAMAFVGATSASATTTQLCKVHDVSVPPELTEEQEEEFLEEVAGERLVCPEDEEVTSVHQVLAAGTVGELLAVIDVLCLGFLVEATALGLGNPQQIHATSQTFTGCGTGSAHNNCTVTV